MPHKVFYYAGTVSDKSPVPEPSGRSRSFSRRQLLVVAASLLLGGFLGWLLFGGHGSGGDKSAAPGVTAKLHPATYPTIGVSVGLPAGWHPAFTKGVVRVLSRDQAASLAISAPAAPGQDVKLRATDVAELKRLFHPARVVSRLRGIIGGLPVLTTQLVGTSPRRTKITILSTAVSGRYRTYSIQVFAALRPPRRTLLELRSVLSSVQFSAPKH